jgi:hypothetical protein
LGEVVFRRAGESNEGEDTMHARLLTVAAVLAALMSATLGATSVAAAPTPAGTVVMSGLDNPRGLTFVRIGGDDDGNDQGKRSWALYVAEAGRGGGPEADCITLPRGGPMGEFVCPGSTGAISRLWRGVQQRVVTGLPSYARPDGSDATGPHDVSFANSRTGYVVIGMGADPSFRAQLGSRLGWTARFSHSGSFSYDVDVSAYEVARNPDNGPIDSNPYGLLEAAGRRYVVEAGGNALLRVGGNGSISTVALFRSRPQGRSTDSVPTAVARGPDGALYVGELTGAPFATGAANVYRVRSGRTPQVVASNFTTILDIDFDRRGNLYVLEHSGGPFFGGTGTLWRIARNGVRTAVVTGLTRPTSVTIGPDGAAYISNRGNEAGVGEVLRFNIGAPPGGDDDDEGDDDDD